MRPFWHGEFTWPELEGCWWPPTKESKGRELNHLVNGSFQKRIKKDNSFSKLILLWDFKKNQGTYSENHNIKTLGIFRQGKVKAYLVTDLKQRVWIVRQFWTSPMPHNPLVWGGDSEVPDWNNIPMMPTPNFCCSTLPENWQLAKAPENRSLWKRESYWKASFLDAIPIAEWVVSWTCSSDHWLSVTQF